MPGDDRDNSAFERGIEVAADADSDGSNKGALPVPDLSRRKILGSLIALGTTGAMTGAGVRSLLYDEEVFGGPAGNVMGNAVGNAFNVNVLQGGGLDLELCWELPGEDCTPVENPDPLQIGTVSRGDTGSGTLRCELEDNPGWTWFRTGCPVDPCGFEDVVHITLWYDENCDGTFDEDEHPIVAENAESAAVPIVDLELCTALSLLHRGVFLDGDPGSPGPQPHRPSENCCLGFRWEVVDFICEDDENLTLTFEFFTEQWRHNMSPLKPPSWEGAECDVDCDTECPPCDFQGISFVAFCIDDDGESIATDDVSFTPFLDAEGEVYRIEWTSTVPLDWVVLFYGSSDGEFFENFLYDDTEGSNDGAGTTSGEVWVNSQTNDPGNAHFHSKLLWEGDQSETSLGQRPSDPCPNLDGADHGCGVRYNFDDDVWDDVCVMGGS